jgi:hypothetical protein
MPINQTFIRIGRNIQSILYEPEKSMGKGGIGIVIMHSDADYLTFPMGAEMALRGYRVLCANVESKYNSLDRKVIDLKLVIETLRKETSVSKIVLMGHSGGGTLMSAYQNLAENGARAFQGKEKLVRCSNDLTDLIPADGIMLLDSNFGIAAMSLFSLDPAVTDEESGLRIDPELDLFNPSNGFNAAGSTYSDSFIKKFQKAQGERNNRLIEKALLRLNLIEKGKGNYADDEPFIVPGAEQGFFNNKLYAQDTRLMSHTKRTWPILNTDGSTITEIVYSVRKPENPESFTRLYHRAALITTVRNYLNSYAVRTLPDYGYNEDSVYGIDWASSYNCTAGNICGVRVPILVMGMTGSWEYLASETIYENAPSNDKTIAFVEGASHLFTPVVPYKGSPGKLVDTTKLVFDYANKWLRRFL